ncbi:Glycosyltransferase BC10 [Linum perenne]
MSSYSPVIYFFSILLSLALIYTIAPQILPSHNPFFHPHDDLDDLALFTKAIRSVDGHHDHHHHHHRRSNLRISRLATKNPTPKIAFLFLTNSNLTFAPLWDRFFRGHSRYYNVYVHADPSTEVQIPNGGAFESSLIPSRKTERASPTLIAAERRLLARAILDDPLNLYFALVSQHCVPIHSFPFFYRSLLGANSLRAFTSQSRHRSFIEILSDDPNLPDRYVARGENVMMPEVPFEEFRVGSQFFVLAKRHAVVVLSDKKLWRKFRLKCLNLDSCYPEEHYFPTLLSMEDPKGCSGFTLTNVNWTDSYDGHPRTYEAPEISASLVRRLRQSNSSYPYFFARKFSPDCLPPLMEMADDVIFRD